MNNLPSIIGPAPSELSFEDFLTKLSVERERVSEELRKFRERRYNKTSKKKTVRKKKSPPLKEVDLAASLSKELNLPADEIEAILKEMRREQKAKGK